jgi:hypothetical protein
MKKKKNTSLSMPSDTRAVPLHQEIATQAYILWNQYGQPTGRDLGIWLEAERQVLGVDAQVNQQAGGAIDAKNLGGAFAAQSLPSTQRAETAQVSSQAPR